MANLSMSAAASSSMASSSASTSCTPWDVFLNHRGPDGKMAARYLYRRLIANGIRRVFLDKEEMEKAQSISRQIIEAIDGASLHIAIFSPRYAESWWCLDELVRMLDSGKPIFPVFFKVNPSVLRHNVKAGEYADALRDLAKKTTADPKTGEENPRYSDDTIHQWRAALSSVADLSGIVIRDEDDELEQLDNVVEKVLKMVPKPLLSVADYPTGLDLKVDEFENFEKKVLSNQERCKVVGIVGAGGVGKTTLAKKLFNLRRSDYSKSSFLFDVRQKDITLLQSNLLKDFIGENDWKIESSDEGSGMLRKYLSSSSFHSLIVLDDIDDASQLRALLPMRDNLSRESLILVTSRDKHVLRSSGVLEYSIYHLKGLSKPHSEELFCCYALNQRFPSPDFEGLVKRFVKSCDGLPLSLKVFGALVSGQEESYWEDTLNKLEKTLPGTEIHKSLKISYDKLSSDDQEIFLDIASFFIGEERDRAIRIWGSQGIVNLQDKCLFELDAENKIRMHDHFRDLARNIAQGLGIRRLWDQSTKDIEDLLEQSSQEMTEVRGIRMLNSYFVGWLNSYFVGCRGIPKARRKRRRDGACGISNLQFVATGAGYYLEPILKKARSPNLRWLRWYDCPYSCLPSWIPMENLRVLEVKGKNIESLWEESRVPLQLRELHIQTFGSVSNFPKSIGQLEYLEKIIISTDSISLRSLPEEFCELRSLKYLCLEGCSYIISLPNSFGRLTNLQHIHLGGAISLQMLPESFGALTQLKSLDLSWTRLQMLPESFGALTQLKSLNLSRTRLQMLPESFGDLTRLESLKLRGCRKLTLSSATLGNITTLEFLDISDCINVRELSAAKHLMLLKELHARRCPKLRWGEGEVEHLRQRLKEGLRL